MQMLEEADYREFANVLRERVMARAPDWTDRNETDPGIMLVELFAFLTESLLYRASAIPERGRASAARLATFALSLAAQSAPRESGALERPRYFFGQLLGVDEFRLEQDYFRERLRRHHRELHGFGVVRGLAVSVQDSGAGEQVVVDPGFALDPHGEEIEVRCPATAPLPARGHLLYVVLLHAERPTHPQPATDGRNAQFTRIQDGYAIYVATAAMGNGVALARLLRADGNWHVDEAFRPARVASLVS